MTEDRVQKIMAHAGIASRRESEKLIEQGRVTVNGKKIILGTKADPNKDDIRVDGSKINTKEDFVYIALNKPRGVLSSTKVQKQQDDMQTILDLVPEKKRIYPVGRLDLDSEGLVLLTNDGELANQLSHPRFGHEKEYRVLVASQPKRKQLDTWQRGVILPDGYHTAPVEVRFERNHGKGAWLRVIMKEGRKRQIRETARAVGLPVAKLIRVRIGSLLLGNLASRKFRYLSDNEIVQLKKLPKPSKMPPSVKKRKY